MSRIITTEIFVDEAKIVHKNDDYDYSKVRYRKSHKKVIIVCNKLGHGIFKQSPSTHLAGSGCPTCAEVKKMTKTEFIKRAKNVKTHKNKRYNYSKVKYINSKTKVIINCHKHGDFLQTPERHLCGSGCIKCSIENTTMTTLKFIERANEIYDKSYFNYKLVTYKNNHTKVEIICNGHGGIIKQKPYVHLLGHGCQICKENEKQKTFINNATRIHKGEFDYSKVKYINNHTKVIIICPKLNHGEFKQVPSSHLSKRGCPICKSSKGEKEIRQFLKNNKINYVAQKKFDSCRNPETNFKLSFDFYVPKHNVCIEFDGCQHFKPIKNWGGLIEFLKIKAKDRIKNRFCKKNNINLIRIKFTQNAESVLIKKLLPLFS